MRAQTYRRGRNSPPLLQDSKVSNVKKYEFGQYKAVNGFRLPGGQGLVEFRNVEIIGPIALNFNHHCNLDTQATGGMCASSYFLNNITNTGNHLVEVADETEANHGRVSTAKQSDMIFQYGEDPVNDKTFILASSHRTFDAEQVGCTLTDVLVHGRSQQNGGYWCPGSLKIRPLLIFSPDRGTLTVTSTHPDDNNNLPRVTNVPKRSKSAYNNLGFGARYCPLGKNSPNGYTMLVLNTAVLEIDVPEDPKPLTSIHNAPVDFQDYFVMWYSEEQWPQQLKSSITVMVTGSGATEYGLAGGPYEIKNDHDRTFTTPSGAYVSEAGAWWEAKLAHGNTDKWSSLTSFLTRSQYEQERINWLSVELSANQ